MLKCLNSSPSESDMIARAVARSTWPRSAQVVGVEARRGLLGCERHHEKQVALDHVNEGTGLVVVPGATLKANGLVEDDVHPLRV